MANEALRANKESDVHFLRKEGRLGRWALDEFIRDRAFVGS
jgi:hypothetical protein